MLSKIQIIYSAFFLTFLIEHLLLKYYYGKKSSLEQLLNFRRDRSTSVDLYIYFFYLFFLKYIFKFFSYFFLPGALYAAIKYFNFHRFQGLIEVTELNIYIFLISYLILKDFCHYCVHFSMHKVKFLWNYHKLHHSTTSFNIITGSRVSINERILNHVVPWITTIIFFGTTKPEIYLYIVLITAIIDWLQHSNLPLEFYGPFKYVFASPRFHRFHHSKHLEDADSNYGNIFSFFDYIFRTTGKRYSKDNTIADKVNLGISETGYSKKIYQRGVLAPFDSTMISKLTIIIIDKFKLRKK